MNLDDLKDRFITEGRATWERIQESAAFNQLRDRYENLSPGMQRLAIAGTVGVIALLILSVPYSNLTQSSDSVTEFEGQRMTIRELLKVSRESADVPAIAQAPSLDMIRANIDNQIKSANLLPEQIKGTNTSSGTSTLIPTNLMEGGLDISLAKLNLRQVMDLGYKFQSINPSVKMKDMVITANREDSRYFDVVYKVVALAVPAPPAPPMEEPPSKGKGRSKKTQTED
ncbi:MAG TPA: hypothetical protein VF412_07435 [Bdellovibrio sp.]|uniref:hypothetical protein n=1 Tax=Bdellovibrio sp. TaxID=28201 RepID=UPI002F00433E